MIRRLPLLAAGLASMAFGVWLGLVRLGWNLPLPRQDQLIAHGPLMVCGFLGTLIALERAVAFRAAWAYAAPVLTAAAAAAVLIGPAPASRVAPLLFTIGSLSVAAIFVVLCRRHPSLFLATMLAGALAWAAGNAHWLAGAAIHRVVFLWLAFLVLTIAGERLELNRVLRPTAAVRAAFVSAAVLVFGGAAATIIQPAAGVRTLGIGLLLLAAWLARHDVARLTIRQRGLTRFMAVSLLGGYAWLAIGGVVALATGAAETGLVYDALLHAVFVGFVISMVFAHAPVIFPAVAGVPFAYHDAFYLHVGLLHASLVLRVVGDLVDVLGRWRAWGGLLNGVAMLIFLANTVRAIVSGGQKARTFST